MQSFTLQVTIPNSGVVNLAAALPKNTGGNGNLTAPLSEYGNRFVQWIQFQNNAAHNIRYGMDNLVSVTTPAAVNGGTAGRGILLASGSPGGAGSQSTPIEYSTMISDWWIAGTAGDVIDVLVLQ
jgi:hypothetical protein